MLAATIAAGPVSAPVRIRNLSEAGAMIDGPALPDAGSTLTLNRLELSVAGTVIWNRGGRCGLRLASTVAVDDWIAGVRSTAHPTSLGQMRIDKIQAAIRGGAVLPEHTTGAARASFQRNGGSAHCGRAGAREDRAGCGERGAH